MTALADAVRRDRERQGLPPTVEDPAALAVVARLLANDVVQTRERRKAS